MNDKDVRPVRGSRTGLYTFLAAVLMLGLIFLVYHFNAPNPNMILITALVLFTGLGGTIPGLVSGVFMLLYSMFFFSTDHSFVHFDPMNMQKMIIITIGVILCFLCVSFLKRNQDRARAKLFKANEELVEANSNLSDTNDRLSEANDQLEVTNNKLHEANGLLRGKADEAVRILKLQESVNSLMMNMPGMTFSKDAHTGVYLACNQAFAEYAHKASPDEVVGLTDHEIFDPDTAQHFVEDDQKALSMDEPYIFSEDVPDAAGNRRQLQTTKIKFTDSAGRLCTLGMCVDVTELVTAQRESAANRAAYEEARNESQIYSGIVRTLSRDYFDLFYVDTETGDYVEYGTYIPGEELAEPERRGEDFFKNSRKNALDVLYEEDQVPFVAAFTKENVLRAIRSEGSFTMIYRLMSQGQPLWVNLKAAFMEGDEGHIIVGVNDIDNQMKQQEAAERAREERVTYSRITALSGDYLVIFTVDPETAHYTEYSARSGFSGVSQPGKGEDFFDEFRQDIRGIAHPDDLDALLDVVNKDYMLREIKEDGFFSYEYRIMKDHIPVYVCMKATMLTEKDGPRIIVGITDIDAQIKREQEYVYNLTLARNKANLDALTGVKNKHAYIDLEAEMNIQIEKKHPVSFAVIVFDVNELKHINDTQGHLTGDRYIKEACGIICSVFKHSPVFRIGGDEFAVIAQGVDYEHLDELLKEVSKNNIVNRTKGGIVIACGASRYDNDRNVAAVFERADRGMYENKKRLKEGVT